MKIQLLFSFFSIILFRKKLKISTCFFILLLFIPISLRAHTKYLLFDFKKQKPKEFNIKTISLIDTRVDKKGSEKTHLAHFLDYLSFNYLSPPFDIKKLPQIAKPLTYTSKEQGNPKTDTTYYGSLSDNKVYNSKILRKKIVYKVYQPPLSETTTKLPVLYVNDGFIYLKKGNLAKKVDNLIYNKKIVPLIIVFIEPQDMSNPKKKIRQELYLANDLYSDFLVKELFPFIEKKYNASKKRSFLGVSFGALSAAYTAIKKPNIFENIILQSPALHPRKQIYTLYKYKKKRKFNIYISYGTGEDTQNQSTPLIKILKDKKYNLKVDVIPNGNHNWKNWRPKLNNILIQYFGIN